MLQPSMNCQEVLGFCLNSVGIWAIIDVDESLPFFKTLKQECVNKLTDKLKLGELSKCLET